MMIERKNQNCLDLIINVESLTDGQHNHLELSNEFGYAELKFWKLQNSMI